MNEIAELIKSLGFPIVVAVGAGYYIYKTQQQTREDNIKREERMYEQLSKFGDSLDGFNLTLTKIDSRLAVVEEKIEGK